MEFFAVNGKRPVRLCEETRKFAFESLNHKYGKQALETPCVEMEESEAFTEEISIEKYDAAIRCLAQKSPIRICENELISGAATLGTAINGTVPVLYDGRYFNPGISHLTLDFETVLKKGVNYLWQKAELAFERHKGTEKEAFSKSCVNLFESFEVWHSRYLDALKGESQYRENYENLKRVPFLPAQSFYEAVQSLWFTFAFTRICGNWSGIGRIDYLLGDYLKADLKSNVITLEKAREILAHFFIKGCEWIYGGNIFGSGDAQHYQNIVLAGVDENGVEVTNEVTLLVLDIIEELGISDFPTTVRLNRSSSKKLLSRVAEVIRYGGGVVAVYNEDLIINSLVECGYMLEEARKFANDGCWEIQIPGKTFFAYFPFDSLHTLQSETLKGYDEGLNFLNFDDLYKKFISDLYEAVERVGNSIRKRCPSKDEKTGEWKWISDIPCTAVSAFEEGCIEKGLSYLEGGPVYNQFSPHIGGLPDTVNSLYAIKKLCFDDKKISFQELMKALKSDWQGYDDLRRYALTKYEYFGNDNDEVDLIAADIIKEFSKACDLQNNRSGYTFPAGVSTFGRQLEWSSTRLATPFGKCAGDILAGNFSPTPGTDKKGATSIIKSYCKTDFGNTVSGAALDIKLLPTAVKGEKGIVAIESLLMAFVQLGGIFMQLDIADTELLKAAQENPQDYLSLSVRISGWNARFVTLNKEWQDMIIAQHGGGI